MSGPQESTAEHICPSLEIESPLAAATTSQTWATRGKDFSEAALMALVVAAGWAITIGHLSLEWRLNVQYEHGWAVPALALYLVGLRWVDRPAANPPLGSFPTQAAFIMCTLAMGVGILFREANPEWRLLGGWFSGGAIGLTFTALARTGGRSWLRHFAFPVFFILTAVPWPRAQEHTLMMTLMSGNARLAAEVLRWCGHEAVVQGNLVALNVGMVGVDEACSGVRSLQGALMISLFLGELWRLPVLRRGLLLIAGLGGALVANALRTVWLGLIIAQAGTATMERWHDLAGYLALAVGFGLILGIAVTLRTSLGAGSIEARAQPAAASIGSGSVKVGATLALVIFVASAIGTKAWFAWHEDYLARSVAWRIVLPRANDSYHDKLVPERIRTELRFEQAESGAWEDAQARHWQATFFTWPPGRNGEQTVLVHDPRVCLQAAGMQHLETLADCVWRRDDLRLVFEAYRFRDGQREVFVFNTVTNDAVRPIEDANLDHSLSRSSRWRAVAAGIRHLGQRRLEVGIWGAVSAEDAQHAFRAFLDDAVQIDRIRDKDTASRSASSTAVPDSATRAR